MKRILVIAAVVASAVALVLLGWVGRGAYQERQEQVNAVDVARKADIAEGAEWTQELVTLSSRLETGVSYDELPKLQAQILSRTTLYKLRNKTANSAKRAEFGDEIVSVITDTKNIWGIGFGNSSLGIGAGNSSSYPCGKDKIYCISLLSLGNLERHNLKSSNFMVCDTYDNQPRCFLHLDDAVGAMLSSVGNSITKAIEFEKSL